MPLIDTAAENAALDACYGDDHAPSWPNSFDLQLWDGRPGDEGSTEITDGDTATWAALVSGGAVWEAVELDDEVTVATYAPVLVANTSAVFPAAVAGAKTTAPIAIGGGTIQLTIFHNDIEN